MQRGRVGRRLGHGHGHERGEHRFGHRGDHGASPEADQRVAGGTTVLHIGQQLQPGGPVGRPGLLHRAQRGPSPCQVREPHERHIAPGGSFEFSHNGGQPIQALRFRSTNESMKAAAHVQGVGWKGTDQLSYDQWIGSIGENRWMEAFWIAI
ncbi:hypothetical protein OG711_37905 [Streptomyces uncialis]|uniref:hypothetical protein n=1 Tax=Streptomyces uncialis TaxID=1048205 RepID=UPI002E378AC2|nr:hypothetical protein [Streptomyces uncialis]